MGVLQILTYWENESQVKGSLACLHMPRPVNVLLRARPRVSTQFYQATLSLVRQSARNQVEIHKTILLPRSKYTSWFNSIKINWSNQFNRSLEFLESPACRNGCCPGTGKKKHFPIKVGELLTFELSESYLGSSWLLEVWMIRLGTNPGLLLCFRCSSCCRSMLRSLFHNRL